jgi:hypothetical protein
VAELCGQPRALYVGAAGAVIRFEDRLVAVELLQQERSRAAAALMLLPDGRTLPVTVTAATACALVADANVIMRDLVCLESFVRSLSLRSPFIAGGVCRDLG